MAVNRARGGDEASDTFAAAAVDIATPSGLAYARSTVSLSKNRHEKAWQWLDKIGEVHYAVHRGAKVAGYARLYAHRVNADGTIGARLKTGQAADIVQGIQSPYGGLRGLIERFFLMMKVPGDAYLIRTRDAQGNVSGYDFLSASEVDISGTTAGATTKEAIFSPSRMVGPIKRITLPSSSSLEGNLTVDIRPEDFIGRVWRPSGRYAEMPDSPMRALDTECELLYTLTIGLKAKLLNRLTLNGLMILDKSIVSLQSGAPQAEPNEFHRNPVLNDFINAMTFAVTAPDQPESAMPIVMQTTGAVPPDKVVHMMTTDREVFQTDMELRRELIERLLMGLDVQPQAVRGMGEASHWSAWAVSDDERRVSIQPDIEVMCWALTRLILNAELNARHVAGEGRVCVWYDLTDANVKTNLAEDGRQLWDRMLVGEEAARRMSGVTETDAPTDNERIRAIGVKMSNAYLATFGLEGAKKLDWEQVAKFGKVTPGPDNESEADPPEAQPGKAAPAKPTESDTPARLRPAG